MNSRLKITVRKATAEALAAEKAWGKAVRAAKTAMGIAWAYARAAEVSAWQAWRVAEIRKDAALVALGAGREGGAMRPADWAKRERARIVAVLRAEAAHHDAEAEDALARCPDAFERASCRGGEREREHVVRTYRACTALGNELRRVADLIEAP